MPLSYLIALFIGLPIVELVLLFELHGLVGFLPTVMLVLLTGIAGAARSEEHTSELQSR